MPPWLLVGAGVLAAVLLVWGGVQAYRAYEFVEHDNDFCLTCHLMVDPYERFARSAHRDLGCKACHRPTFAARSSMALTQVLENPDSLETHAEVPDAVCIECHVEGDPDKWRNIAASAGHRVHLESDDPALQGLQCVACHSSSLHEFAASDRTCGQAGCHESQEIRLGAMGGLTIHCATCHAFNARVAGASNDSVHLALRPQREECLSCHAMRTRLASFPLDADDPHGGACGACHNPHAQTEPAQAFQTCSTCHEQVDTLTPFHRALDTGVLETCSRCHDAHTFHAEGSDCRSCHVDAPQPSGATAERPVFDHAQHTQVECSACHSSTQAHGTVTATSVGDCRSCHHTAPVMQPCTRCHATDDAPAAVHDVRRAFRPSVGDAENRTYPFDHRQHTTIGCERCHQSGPELSAASTDCSACHTDHHDPENNCIACHTQPPRSAHTRDAHLTCAGSGCHESAPVTAAQRTRTLCLSCHQDMTDHQPGRRCADCHALPAPRQSP